MTIPFTTHEYATLGKKTYGRIFVLDPNEVQAVEDIAEQLDEFEWSYYPKGFIVAWGDEPELMYGHKFEINYEALTRVCWDAGIAIWCVTGHRDPLP